jgi:hypothetical protein
VNLELSIAKPDHPLSGGSDAEALSRFRRLLEARNCHFLEERELSQVLPRRRKKPDFFARTQDGHSILIEVESFEKERAALRSLRQNSVMSGLSGRDNVRMNTALQHASSQLKHYSDLGYPSLVVLDDFRKIGMPHNVDILGMHLSNYFNLQKDHLSAVAWFLEDPGGEGKLRIFHNPSAKNSMLPDKFIFSRDEHWKVPKAGKF